MRGPGQRPLSTGLPTVEEPRRAMARGSAALPSTLRDTIADNPGFVSQVSKEYRSAGASHIPPRVMREDLEWFAAEVMPEFQPKGRAGESE